MSLCLRLLLLISVLLIAQSCEYHRIDRPESATAVQTWSRNAEADGRMLPLKTTDGDVKTSILSQPLPDIWLVFRIQNGGTQPNTAARKDETMKIDLESEAKVVLQQQWNAALDYCYTTEFIRPTRQLAYDVSTAFAHSTSEAWRELQKLSISTPDGKRKIRYTEAASLTGYLLQAARKTIDEAKSAT